MKTTIKAAWITFAGVLLAATITTIVMIATKEDVTVNIKEELPETKKDIKVEIRTFLRETNPEIITRIDQGDPQVAVMINAARLPELLKLQKKPEFQDYLDVRGNGNVMFGNSNTMEGHLNDVLDGQLLGYILTVKDPLRLK